MGTVHIGKLIDLAGAVGGVGVGAGVWLGVFGVSKVMLVGLGGVWLCMLLGVFTLYRGKLVGLASARLGAWLRTRVYIWFKTRAPIWLRTCLGVKYGFKFRTGLGD